MAGEYWSIMVLKHDRGPNTDIVEKKIERDKICYSNLVRLLEVEGYKGDDDLFYSSSDRYSCGTLSKIEGETHVHDMIMENEMSKRADLHMFNAIARTPFSPLNIDAVQVVPCEDEYTQQIAMEEDKHSISSGDTDHEQEKIDYIEELKERKRQREDPMNHCEGDTDIEDMYVHEVDEVNAIEVLDVEDGVDTPATCELSDPASEGGGLSALEDETDEENKPPPEKRRRGKRNKVGRIYFDESNMIDQSQLCEGMCFTNAQQFRRALKSYHIVQGRDFKYITNKGERVNVKCVQDKVKCAFFIRASKVGTEKTFMIRKMVAPHACPANRSTTCCITKGSVFTKGSTTCCITKGSVFTKGLTTSLHHATPHQGTMHTATHKTGSPLLRN